MISAICLPRLFKSLTNLICNTDQIRIVNWNELWNLMKLESKLEIPRSDFPNMLPVLLLNNLHENTVMGIKGRRVHMIEELSQTIISFQRGKWWMIRRWLVAALLSRIARMININRYRDIESCLTPPPPRHLILPGSSRFNFVSLPTCRSSVWLSCSVTI